MKTLTTAALIAGLVLPMAAGTTAARADDGRIAAGIAGGFLGGMLLGGALSHPAPRYYAPAPVYDAPVDYAPPPHCYWARGEAVWDPYEGVYHHRRVRVCE